MLPFYFPKLCQSYNVEYYINSFGLVFLKKDEAGLLGRSVVRALAQFAEAIFLYMVISGLIPYLRLFDVVSGYLMSFPVFLLPFSSLFK